MGATRDICVEGNVQKTATSRRAAQKPKATKKRLAICIIRGTGCRNLCPDFRASEDVRSGGAQWTTRGGQGCCVESASNATRRRL